MHSYKRKWIAGVMACVALTVGCEDFLEVEQTVQPTTSGIFENDGDFEAVIGSIWRVWWGTAQSSRPTNGVQTWPAPALATIAEELTASSNNVGHAHTVGQEPRIQYDNDQNGGNWFMRKPFYDMYQCIATSTEALQFLAGPDVIIGDPNNPEIGDHTARAFIWSKMLQGMCHVYVGLLYDQGYIIDESIPSLMAYDYANNLKPYTEITAHGVKLLQEAIDSANASLVADTIPCTANWLNGRCAIGGAAPEHVLTRPTNLAFCEPATGTRPPLSAQCPQHLVEFMHTMIARAYAYNARTPSQRMTVGSGLNKNYTDWDKVLEHANKGVRSDFWVQATGSSASNNAVDSYYKRYTENSLRFRIDNELVGPADSSGAFQAWATAPLETRNAIVVRTTDRRIHGVDVFNTTGTLTMGGHRTPGSLIRPVISSLTCTSTMLAAQPGTNAATCFRPLQEFGTVGGLSYMFSNYMGYRYGTAGADHWYTGRLVTTNAKEMEFLKAEAHFHKGNKAQTVAIINAQGRTKPRTAQGGELPAVTLAGPPQSTPEEQRTCVPKRKDGTCGDLFDALKYEKRLELYGLEAIIPFADARGWGLMLEGSICNLAIPNRETDAIGRGDLNYTFGGNAPGSVGRGPAASGAICSDP